MKIQDITEGYGRYYCSTDKKWKTRKGPKQTRKVSEEQGVAEASIPYALSAANYNAEFERQHKNRTSSMPAGGGYRGRVELDVESKEDYLATGRALKKAADAAGQHIEYGLSGGVMKVFSDSLTTDELDTFVDDALENFDQGVAEEKQRLDPKCWDGYKKDGTKMKGGVRVNNCVKEELEETYDGDEFFEAYGELWYNEDEQLDEAEYQGRNVPLGKPMQGDVKKFKVYVKDPSTGNVKKVNFGDPDMKIRKSNPAARRSFRARHNCDNPGPRTKARYWSCRKW